MKFDDYYMDSSYIKSKDNRLWVSLSENKRTYRGINRNRQPLIVYHVDGGITTDNSARCDYAVYTKTDHLYLIELKGSDYPHALEQLTASIGNLLREVSVSGVYCRIVLSRVRVPNIQSTQETGLKKLLYRSNGAFNEAHLKKQNRILTEEII
jgi:hypothetical protein